MLNTCSYQILRVIKFLNNEVLCEIFLAKHGIFIALNLCDDVLLMILWCVNLKCFSKKHQINLFISNMVIVSAYECY